MLQHLQCVRVNPAPFRPQPISRSMEEGAIRFELERQACQSLRKVLQLKLQQRRTREELVSQGIMPPLKSSTALHEQRRCLERARTEDCLKRKIKNQPERSELIRTHIFEGTSAEQSLQAKQLQLKRARLAEDLNDKIAHRPGPMELIHKNIIPVHSSIKHAIIDRKKSCKMRITEKDKSLQNSEHGIILREMQHLSHENQYECVETEFPKALGENSSCDEHSNDSLSPGQPVSQDCPLSSGPVCSPTGKLTRSIIPSPTQVPSSTLPFPLISDSSASLKLTNGMVESSVQSMGVNSHIKPKPTSDRLSQRHKKTKDNKPKIKKLKYHQYIPPDQKGDKEPPPHLDSSYTKILQQQQLYLQLQILSQQQQQQQSCSYPTILPAPPKDQKTSSFSSPDTTSSPTSPAATPQTVLSKHCSHICLSSAPVDRTKTVSLHPNLDGMKVAELKSELKLRSLPVSGTKNDLIERLKTYQELSHVISATSSTTAGGTTGLEPEGAGKAPKTAKIITTSNSTTQEQQFQSPSIRGDAGGSCSPCGGNVNSILPRSRSPAATSPKDTSFRSNESGELVSSPLVELSLQPSSVAHLPAYIKEEPPCCTTAPCQFSLNSASVQKHCLAPSAAPTTIPTAPLVTIDKDRMLQEKDKQIADLTRMLRQKQRLVEALKMQLENENREVSEQLILLRVKEEPPDNFGLALSTVPLPLPPQILSSPRGTDDAKVTIKQESVEAEIGRAEASVQMSDDGGPLQSSVQTQQVQNKTHPKLKQIQKRREHVCLQQSALQQAQQQAIQKVLQKNQMIKSHMQVPDVQQTLCQMRQKKPQKLQPKQQERQKQQTQPKQQRQQPECPLQLKHQKQQQQQRQRQRQRQQIQIHLKQQQAPQANLGQQSGSAPPVPLDHLKNDSTPALVTDTNGNHFLISLSSQNNGDQTSDTSKEKVASHITMQRLQSTPAKLPGHPSIQVTIEESGTKQQMKVGKTKAQNGALRVSVEQPQQEVVNCLSAPPTLQPFFKDQGFVSPVKNTTSSYFQTDKENEEDFIDFILQAGEMAKNIRPAPEPCQDHLHPDSSAPSPLPLLPSPPIPPSSVTPQPEPRAPADTKAEKQHLNLSSNGRLEDFLESTTGKPLLGVEPGGLLTLIDDLHNQLLCTPSILDHPPFPMDTFDMTGEGQQGLDSTDWLDLTMDGEKDEETPALAPLAPQTPLSVFSAEFLDSSDLHIHWDSCL